MVGACAGMPIGEPAWPTVVKPGADRQLAGDEVGATRRAARLGVIVGEPHALGGKLVEVRRPARHDALVIGADVEPADVVAHDDDDIRWFGGRLCRRRAAECQRQRKSCCYKKFLEHRCVPFLKFRSNQPTDNSLHRKNRANERRNAHSERNAR